MFKINNLTAFFFTYFCPRFYGSPPSPSANTTSSTTATPWSGASQYLTNGNSAYKKDTGMFDNNGKGPTGLYEQIGNYANQYSNLTPEQQNLKAMSDNAYAGRYGTMQNAYNDSTALGNKISGGAYDTNYGPVANAGLTNANVSNAGLTNANASNAGLTNANVYQGQAATSNASLSNLVAARKDQGVLDPTKALSQTLSGKIDNPYLQGLQQANINTSMRGYNDAIQNLNQQVMPGINNDAFAAGQYGGSRQGIAQGLALQGMDRSARDLGISAMDNGTALYGNAYQNAQQRMTDTANNINTQAGQNAQYNASNMQQNNQFNAGNQQAMNIANMNALNNGSQFNATSANDMSKYNSGQTNDMSKFNSGQANDMSKYNSGQVNDMSKFNAGQGNNMSQFNANLGLQNNTQGMLQQAQNMGNATTGNELNNTALTRLFSGQDQNYSNQMTNANLEQQQKLDMLNMKLGAYSPGANLGGSSTASTPYYDNTLGNIGGMAAGAGGFISALKGK